MEDMNHMNIEALGNNFEEPTWTAMPILVSHKLFGLLGYRHKKIVRQVCRDWKFAVDHISGHSIVLDEFRDGDEFLEFLQTIKICQASLGNLEPILKNSIKWNYPGSLRKVTCHGHIEKDWFSNHILKQCQNLNKLILKEDFLSKLTISDETPPPIICPNLKSLEIISPRGSIFPRHYAMSYYLNVFSDASMYPRTNAHSIQDSMHYILKTIRSPKLSLVSIYVYENYLISKPDVYWKQCPFEEFIEAHRNSLKEVYLHEFHGNRSNEPTVYRFLPSQLSNLQVSIHRFHQTEGNPKTEQNQDFLKLLLVNQTRLEELSLELHKMRTVWIFDVLTSIIRSCTSTIRILKIQILRADEDDCILSGIVFSELLYLEELRLEGDALTNNVVTLADFAWLPKTLRKILTMFMRIDEKDFHCIHEFTQLKYLELNHVILSDEGPENDDHNEEGENPEQSLISPSDTFMKILKELLCHRELDHLGVSLSKSVSANEALKNLIESIATTPRPLRYSACMPNYYGLVIAHQYEIDDKFDLYKTTNRESIYSDDFLFHLHPQKDRATISLVELRVEVDRREAEDSYGQNYNDEYIFGSNFSDTSSGMPSLSLISDYEDDIQGY